MVLSRWSGSNRGMSTKIVMSFILHVCRQIVIICQMIFVQKRLLYIGIINRPKKDISKGADIVAACLAVVGRQQRTGNHIMLGMEIAVFLELNGILINIA